jgi:predicted Rossmann-fold nucleotide-binding protein
MGRVLEDPALLRLSVVDLEVGAMSTVLRREFVKVAALGIAGLSARTKLIASSIVDERCPMKLSEKENLTVLTTLDQVVKAGTNLKESVIKGVKLSSLSPDYWRRVTIYNVFFLGCIFDQPESQEILLHKGALLFPKVGGLPYDPYRVGLYTPDELYSEVCSGTTLDAAIYQSFIAKGKFSPDVMEALMRRIHDDSIDGALQDLIERKGSDKVVGIMGGSSNLRNDEWYQKTAEVTWFLTRSGYFVMSGGGPGMMEAANLGAYMANYDAQSLKTALGILATAADPKQPSYTQAANSVKKQFPNKAESLGIPTWFYGFEPTNLFATSVAKYFANSIREAGMLQIAEAGVVFAPGSAGTRQEVFMEAAQDHYGTTGFYSPMVFLGTKQYTVDAPVYPLLQTVAKGKAYADFLFITDDPQQILDFMKSHPPKPAATS